MLLINTISRIKKLFSNYKLNKKFSSIINSQDQQIAFKSLILSHQAIFGLPRIRWIQVDTQSQLKTVNLRLPFKEIAGNSMTRVPVINPQDKRLLFILIYFAHTKYVDAVSSRVHVTHVMARSVLQQGTFPIFCPNLSKYLRRQIQNCGICNRIKQRPFQCNTSTLRFSEFIKQPKPLVMKFIAIDTVPNVRLRLSSIDKLSRLFYIYVVECLVTSYVAFYLSESATLKSTQLVINNVSTQFRTDVEFVTADHGSENFSLSPDDIIFNQNKNIRILIVDPKRDRAALESSSS